MSRQNPQTSEEMIDYMIDCTLATVVKYMYAKTINKSEFERQCNIAQHGITFLGNYDFQSRAKEVVASGLDCFAYYSKQRNDYQAKRALQSK